MVNTTLKLTLEKNLSYLKKVQKTNDNLDITLNGGKYIFSDGDLNGFFYPSKKSAIKFAKEMHRLNTWDLPQEISNKIWEELGF